MVSKFGRDADAGDICEEQTDAEDLREVPQKRTCWGYRADVYHGVFIECGFLINFTKKVFILDLKIIISYKLHILFNINTTETLRSIT